jgi:predicted aspartyl protease
MGLRSLSEFPLLKEGGVLVTAAQVSGPRGSRIIRLALDTGATNTMIPNKAALAVGIHPDRAKMFREVVTANGTVLIPFVRVPRMTLFGKTLRNVILSCHDLPPESPIDGLLGLDLLNLLNALIDVRGLKLIIRPI